MSDNSKFIVTVVNEGVTFWLGGTVWRFVRERAGEYESREAAQRAARQGQALHDRCDLSSRRDRAGGELMAFGDYYGPGRPNKGKEGGACNRQRCQAEPALYYNHGSHAWYCVDCCVDIGLDSFNLRDWNLNWRPRLGHPMFETREAMNERAAGEAQGVRP